MPLEALNKLNDIKKIVSYFPETIFSLLLYFVLGAFAYQAA